MIGARGLTLVAAMACAGCHILLPLGGAVAADSAGSHDGRGSDLDRDTASDAPRDVGSDAPRDLAPLPAEVGVVDVQIDDLPAKDGSGGPCSSWSAWSTCGVNPAKTCFATCGGTAVYSIECSTGAPVLCNCWDGGTLLGSITYAFGQFPAGCDFCTSAFENAGICGL